MSTKCPQESSWLFPPIHDRVLSNVDAPVIEEFRETDGELSELLEGDLEFVVAVPIVPVMPEFGNRCRAMDCFRFTR